MAHAVHATDRYDWVFVTNSISDQQGRRFFIPIGGVDCVYGTCPCFDGEHSMNFSPTGASWGIARNYSVTSANDFLYVSISGDGGADGCPADSSEQCLGAAIVDLSTGELYDTEPYSWNPNHFSDHMVVPDVLGNNDDIVLLFKDDEGRYYQHHRTDDTVDFYTADVNEATQLEWLDGRYFVATAAGSTVLHDSCDNDEDDYSGHGRLYLGVLAVRGSIPFQ